MAVDPAWVRAAAGGVLIGLAAGGFHLATREIAGISGIVRGAMTGPGRGWKLAFLAGLLATGVIASLLGVNSYAQGIEGEAVLHLVPAGLLVGLGAGIGNGCTSGHGVCGLARLSPRSLTAVATFMLTAALTTFVARHGLPR